MKKEKNKEQFADGIYEKNMSAVIIEYYMRTHIEELITQSGDEFHMEHPYIGLTEEAIEMVDPSLYIIDKKEPEKRDTYISWVFANPGKEVPEEIQYKPSPQFGIREDEEYVQIFVFDGYICTKALKIDIRFYYDRMPKDKKQIILNSGMDVIKS